MRYLQGETISLTIESSDINLSETNFTIWIYKHSDQIMKIRKNEMTAVEGGGYSFLINSSVCANLCPGRYFMEIVSEDDAIVISRAYAFEIICCVSKGGL